MDLEPLRVGCKRTSLHPDCIKLDQVSRWDAYTYNISIYLYADLFVGGLDVVFKVSAAASSRTRQRPSRLLCMVAHINTYCHEGMHVMRTYV